MRKIPSQAEYRYLLREFQTQMRFKHSCILEILGHSEATEVGVWGRVNPGVPRAGDGAGRTESGGLADQTAAEVSSGDACDVGSVSRRNGDSRWTSRWRWSTCIPSTWCIVM